MASTPEHTIAVAGSGKVTVVPDMATVSLGVNVQKQSAKAAREAGAEAMTKVIAAIKALGIDDKDITTSMVSLGPVYDYQSNVQKIIGYQLQNTVSITVRDLTKVSDVLDDSVAAGATTVNGVSFDVSDRTAAEAKAREAAMFDAKAKADTLSKAAGVAIVGVASISETVSTPIWYSPRDERGGRRPRGCLDPGHARLDGHHDHGPGVLPHRLTPGSAALMPAGTLRFRAATEYAAPDSSVSPTTRSMRQASPAATQTLRDATVES